MIRLGYQIPQFNYPGVGPEELFDRVSAQALAAEGSGFDTVLVMDHFYQLPMLGPPDAYMLECYTLLAALAAQTTTVNLSALVTGNTYRNPAMLAKTVTTLDVISGGRAVLGIGAGWFEEEHTGYGFEFGTFTDRFERLEEALQIIGPMLRGERPTVDGKWYSAHEAINEPRIRERGPAIMVGGSGEKKTLRMVAQYADESNLTCSFPEIPRKLDALAEHCDDVGRDRSDVNVSTLSMMIIGETMAEAERLRDERVAAFGMGTWNDMPEEMRADLSGRMLFGDPSTISEQVQAEILDRGCDGVTFSIVNPDPSNTDLIVAAGEALAPLFG